MARDIKYGKVTTEHGAIPYAEPVVVFRAQDVLALIMLRDYAALAGKAGCTEKFKGDIIRAIHEFEIWGGVRKLPD